MKKFNGDPQGTMGLAILAFVLLPLCSLAAEETIRYSSSAQVNEAFGEDFIAAFSKESGIKVETTVSSSQTAVHRLLSDFSDIASTTERIALRHKEFGYVQIPFCRDPLVVAIHPDCGVDNLTAEQVKGIFSKTITNWKELGGTDKQIIVIIPAPKTGAYKNFCRQVMPDHDLNYDFSASRSTHVLDGLERFPEGITFIGFGATKAHPKIKVLKIDGHAPEDVRYPYYQIYSYVTKGNPVGAVQKFVQFVLTPKGREIIKNKGMKPIR